MCMVKMMHPCNNYVYTHIYTYMYVYMDIHTKLYMSACSCIKVLGHNHQNVSKMHTILLTFIRCEPHKNIGQLSLHQLLLSHSFSVYDVHKQCTWLHSYVWTIYICICILNKSKNIYSYLLLASMTHTNNTQSYITLEEFYLLHTC